MILQNVTNNIKFILLMFYWYIIILLIFMAYIFKNVILLNFN